MRIGDKPEGSGDGEPKVEIAPPGGTFRRLGQQSGDDDTVTLGEDLYGILCELLDTVPLETQLGIATAFQSRPHPTFAELGGDVREAFEAGAAAFDDDGEGDEDDDEDEDTDGDERE